MTSVKVHAALVLTLAMTGAFARGHQGAPGGFTPNYLEAQKEKAEKEKRAKEQQPPWSQPDNSRPSSAPSSQAPAPAPAQVDSPSR